MLPKAGMIIRESQNNKLDYANFRLMQETSAAIAEAIKRYPFEVDSVDFTNNGLRGVEAEKLILSLSQHYSTLKILNLSENKIGFIGAKALADAVPKIILLESLDLSSNYLGDSSVNTILKKYREETSSALKLKSLKLSQNDLGKSTAFKQCMATLSLFLGDTSDLEELDLSWNNIRGEGATILI